MKNFEERYTAWLDGALDERERAEFEATLPDRDAALRDAAEWNKLSGLMRESLVPVAMPHADFVNSQVLAQIERETPVSPKPEPSRGWFPVGRLVWAGALLLVVAAGISVTILPDINKTPEERYISQVLAAQTGDPKLGAYSFAAPGGKGAVLWVQDAGYIPANERIR